MGSNQIVVVAVLLLATATHFAYGQLPGLINAANITGRICCTPTGNCANGSVGIPGVEVDLNCTTLTGSVVKLTEGITGLDGTFAIIVETLFNLPRTGPCDVFARLPLNATVCPILAATEGVLTAALTIVGTLVDEVLGLVAHLLVRPFRIATVTI